MGTKIENFGRLQLQRMQPEEQGMQKPIGDGLWDGCEFLEGGQGRGMYYQTSQDFQLRGPYKTGCEVDGALCYTNYMTNRAPDQVVEFYLQQECVLPVTLKQVAAGWHNAYALLTDGTVLHAGWGRRGEGDCMDWTDIVHIAATEDMVLGINTSGDILFAGDYDNGKGVPDLSPLGGCTYLHCSWSNIVGMTSSGAPRYWRDGDAFNIQSTVNSWGTVSKIVASRYNVAALFPNGTCDVAGWSALEWRDTVNSWSGIVDIAATDYSVHGLKSDGTVVSASGSYFSDFCADVDTWTNIAKISAGFVHMFGIKNNAQKSVVFRGLYGAFCDGLESEWTNIEQCCAGRNVLIAMTSCAAYACGNDDYGAVSGAESQFDYCL